MPWVQMLIGISCLNIINTLRAENKNILGFKIGQC